MAEHAALEKLQQLCVAGRLWFVTAIEAPDSGRYIKEPPVLGVGHFDQFTGFGRDNPLTKVARQVTVIEPHPVKPGFYRARTTEGDRVMGTAESLLTRLTEYERARLVADLEADLSI
ncbi:MAG: hypothetical protein AB7R89_25735 [Dehalococcoidia bacterium]